MDRPDEPFLRTIRESPHDDAPRLVYADYLEENGRGDRAEFIRLQCRLAGLAEDDPKRTALEKRERQLLQKYAKPWRAELPTPLRNQPFHRGFVMPCGDKRLSVRQFLEMPDEVFFAVPLWSVGLALRASDPDAEPAPGPAELAASPRLLQAGELHLFADGCDPEALDALLNSPHLANVRWLVLSGHGFGVAHLRTLAAAPALARLRGLSVFCWVGPEGVEVLAAAAGWTELSALFLPRCGVTDAGLRALLSSPHLSRIERLGLQGNGLGVGAALALMESANRERLLALDLKENQLGDDGARLLALAPPLARLTRLDLGKTRIGPVGGRALADSPYLGRLRKLRLGGNLIGGDVVAVDALRTRYGGAIEL